MISLSSIKFRGDFIIPEFDSGDCIICRNSDAKAIVDYHGMLQITVAHEYCIGMLIAGIYKNAKNIYS